MTLVLSTDDAAYTNDLTITGAPGVRMTGSRIRFTNSESGRVISLNNVDPAIIIEGNGGTIINMAGGVIRLANPPGSLGGAAIVGSAGNDVVMNSGAIGGRVLLGGGNDEFHNLGDGDGGSYQVDLGAGDDVFFMTPSASGLGAINLDGGAGEDRLVIAGPRLNFLGNLTGVEILEIETNGTFQHMSGLNRIDILFNTPLHNFTAVVTSDSPNATVFLGGNDVSLSNGIVSFSQGVSLGSILGDGFANHVIVENDTIISGLVNLGGGDDIFSVGHGSSLFSGTALQSLATFINGGDGNDVLDLQLQGGDIFNATNAIDFERVWITANPGLSAASPPANFNLAISDLNAFTQVRITGNSFLFGGPLQSVTLSDSNLSLTTVELGQQVFLNIGSDVLAGALESLAGPNPDPNFVPDPTASMFVNNAGVILGDVTLWIGDDQYDGRLGSVGGSIFGYAGNDTLLAGAGNDRIFGGVGNDTIRGGDGNDVIDVGSGSDSAFGEGGDDVFVMSRISSGFPISTFDGGSGLDTLDYSVAASFLFFQSVQGAASAFNVGDDQVINVERVIGGAAGDIFGFTWFAQGVEAFGRDGDDSFWGGSGSDVFFGEQGNDRFNSVAIGDRVDGGAGNDYFFVSGAFGVPTLLGSVVGGDGDDTLSLNISFNVDLDAGTAISGSAQYNVASIENVIVAATGGYFSTVVGSAASERFSVNPLFNDGSVGVVFSGRGGDDSLNGGAGGDTLDGGAGDDRLDGGTGRDTFVGGLGNDTFILDRADESVTELAGEGTDTVIISVLSYALGANIENLIFSSAGSISYQGNDLSNSIQGGGSADDLYGLTGNDSLYGLAGNDYLSGGDGADYLSGGDGNDVFIGGAGVDTMLGGLGDDVFYAEGADTIIDYAGAGYDTINVNESYNLTAGSAIERLSTTNNVGTGNFTLVGNEFVNLVIANNGNNRVDGGAGSDTLYGLGGADLFDFSTALGVDNVDTIGDFNSVDDLIFLDRRIFTGMSTGYLDASAFLSGAGATTATTAAQRIIYNSTTGDVYYDADGAGGAAAIKFATIGAGNAAFNTDFYVY
jgi:Ca2+-binding RTX toxin-like protein